jgi:transposase InsO family protein
MDDSVEVTDGFEPIRNQDAWARLRFSIVGRLLAAPPGRGELHDEIEKLAAKSWRHPISGEWVRFGRSTIERWYYQARNARIDPVGELRRRARKDAGRQPTIGERLKIALRAQHQDHPTWTYQLHFDNLEALVAGDAELGGLPSYSTVRRYMKAQGLVRLRRPKGRHKPVPAQPREVRSYEVEYVHGLWHADFHEGSRCVLTRDGQWQKPLLLAALDDRSRLCCHAQWYLDEEAESFVHGLGQAFQKRGLPRELMTDRGSAMRAAETQQGLHELGVLWQPTLPYSPHQNAKQEIFWGSVEGRLLPMLEGEAELTLALLNEATQPWVELDYNQKLHSGIGTTPIRAFLDGKSVGRDCPGSDVLRRAFRAEFKRRQRQSDGTIPLFGRRFEIPSRLRTLEHVCVRVARWDLGFVHVVDERSGAVLGQVYPLDKASNAEGIRRTLGPIDVAGQAPRGAAGTAPLLKKLMADYSATGLPPAYLPNQDLADDSGDQT